MTQKGGDTLFLTAGEGNRQFVLAQGRPSPVQRINDDPEFAKVNPHWDAVKRALTSAVALPQTSAWGRVNAALNTAVARTLRGEASPREALAQAQAAQEGQQALDELRR